MVRKNILMVVIAIVAILLVVWFTAPGKEEKAATALIEAQKIEESGKLSEAIEAYQKVVTSYLGTKAADEAAANIERVKANVARAATLEAIKVLERLALVLNGYQEMLGALPASIQQLDSGEYMFDSEYMAEIPPEGFTCYVLFEPTNATYQLFSFQQGKENSVWLGADGKSRSISRSDLDLEISKPGLQRIEKGRVVFLQPTL